MQGRNPTEHPELAIFIASSDNTADVFVRVFPGYGRFWPEPEYPIFVGRNTGYETEGGPLRPQFTAVLAPPSGWRSELREQLRQVPAERVLLMLDDFLLLDHVDADRLRTLQRIATERDLPYLCLTVAHRPYLPRLLLKLFNALRGRSVSLVPPSMPYYATLQAAIWKKTHLLRMLEKPGSIWEFEHDTLPGVPHYIYTGPEVLAYRHVVEKGRWQPNAERAFRKAGLPFEPGQRAMRPPGARLRMLYDTIKYHLIGYAFVRVKRRFTGKI